MMCGGVVILKTRVGSVGRRVAKRSAYPFATRRIRPMTGGGEKFLCISWRLNNLLGALWPMVYCGAAEA